MRITSKGQVTIPVEVREKIGLQPGDEVEFVAEGESVVMRRSQTPKHETRGDRAVRVLRGTGDWPAETTDDIMRLLRGDPPE
jgi:AbrB family looped-hinge helix DNA binding protein